MAIEANQSLLINKIEYVISEHPQAKGMPYGQEGRKAVVYQLAGPNDNKQALKVFKRRFRIPRMTAIAEKLEPYAGLPGLQVCQRTVLTASCHADLLSDLPELTYAILMPWIDGQTWQECMLEHKLLTPQRSLDLARSLIQVLVKMEEQGLAHCDLSGPNIILSSRGQIVLVDLEEMYGPGFIKSDALPSGSPGYGHRTAGNGLWSSAADRFAGAVLVAEILGWCDERIRQEAWGESYFSVEELQQNTPRAELLKDTLMKTWGKRIADLYISAWGSDALEDCPTFAEWMVALPRQAMDFISVVPEVNVVDPEIDPGSITEFIALGKKFEAQGNPTGAGLTYKHALSLVKPGSPQALEIETTLQKLSIEHQADDGDRSAIKKNDMAFERGKDGSEVVNSSEPNSNPQKDPSDEDELDQEGYHRFWYHPEGRNEEFNQEIQIKKEESQNDPREKNNDQPDVIRKQSDPRVNPLSRVGFNDAYVRQRFNDAKVAIERKDWQSAKKRLEFVLLFEQDFQHDGETAQDLLSQVQREIANEGMPDKSPDPLNGKQSAKQDQNTSSIPEPEIDVDTSRRKDAPLTPHQMFQNVHHLITMKKWTEAKDLVEKSLSLWPDYQVNGQTFTEFQYEINKHLETTSNTKVDDAYAKKVAWTFLFIIILGIVLINYFATH